LKWTLKIQFRN